MKGEYSFVVRGKRARFSFTIHRNITIIKGDSATGKTTLLSMMYEYLRSGRESGYSVEANVDYFVYLRDEPGRDWTDVLLPLHDTVIFIEENNEFVYSHEFAEFVKNSGNYFVIVSRASLKMLPYSIHEIYEIVTSGQHSDLEEMWHTFQELYSNFPLVQNNRIENVLTEDSNSGFEFCKKVFSEGSVLSANGNSNISRLMSETEKGDLLIIADGAAFGAYMEDCISVLNETENTRISLWLPESFEYLILKSGVVSSPNLEAILEATSEYVESSQYISWERFFTDLLINITKDTMYPYSKHHLVPYYLSEGNINKITAQFPDAIRDNLLRID